MAMKKSCKEALQKSLSELTENLHLEPVLIQLQSQECLSSFVVEEIRGQSTETNKRAKFVELLQTCGQNAYEAFRSYLETAPGQQYLGEILDSHNTKPDPWAFFEGQFQNILCDHDTITKYPNLPGKLHLLLIGKTGSGKSATGNTILNENTFETDDSTQSCTKSNDKKLCRIGRKEIHIIDTPGLFDNVRNITNEKTLLSIVNAVIAFQTGIHAFLLVMNFTKFTPEEEKALEDIENILTDKVYRHCVVVLTHSKDRFASTESKPSLRKFIEAEQESGGAFSRFLKKVDNRVIAVENHFEDLLHQKHREQILSCLAQVVLSNEGRLYSNQLFVSAQQKFQKETDERKKRYEEDDQVFEVAHHLETFLLTTEICELPPETLTNLTQYLSETGNKKKIMQGAKVPKQLKEHKTVVDIFDKFPESYQSIVNLHIESKNEFNDLKGKEHQLNETNVHCVSKLSLRILTLTVASAFVKKTTKQNLEDIIRKGKVPDDIVKGVRESYKGTLDDKALKDAIKEEMLGDPGLLQSTLEEEDTLDKAIVTFSRELSSLHSEQTKRSIREDLLNRIPYILRQLYDSESDLFSCIGSENRDPDFPFCLTDKILQELNKFNLMEHNSEDNRSYIEKCSNFMCKYVAMLEEERASIEKLQKKFAKFKNTKEAMPKIGDIIDADLKKWLTSKPMEELKNIDREIASGSVPNDIRKFLIEKLYGQFKVLDEDEVEKEILIQLQKKREIVKQLIKEARCFPGSSVVFTKNGKSKLISTLEVGEEVLTYNCKGELSHEKIYLFSHAIFEKDFLYIYIRTENGRELLISPEHLLPLNSVSNNVPAVKASVGDTLFSVLENGLKPDKITSVCFRVCKGAFSPMTMSGSIIVNSVASSCYTTFFNPMLARILLFPIRCMFRALPQCIFNIVLPYDDEEGMPKILATCRSGIMQLRNRSLKTK